MQNYGNYETQQLKMNYLNLDQKNVKKNQNQNEKLKKAVTYTLGALAGVGVAALIGYGIINKSQGKKVVDKAKDAASEAVNKGKDKINPSSQEKGKEVLFKVLADIQKGTPITLQDLRTAKTTLSMMVPSDEKYKQVVSKYLVLLDTLINQYKEKGTNSFKVEGSLKDEATKLETESHNVFTQVLAKADFEAYLKDKHIVLTSIEEKTTKKDKLVFVNGKQEVDLKKAKSSPKPDNLILLNEDKKIYVMNNVYETKDDTKLYILRNKEYYTITAGDLKELADVRNITEKYNAIKPDDIKEFDKKACEILKCKLDTEKKPALYIYGAKATATATGDELKYIKISALSKDNLILLIGNNIFESIVKENDIATATWSAVLNENPDKFVDGDSLTKAGESLMAALNERINQAEKDTDKAKIITSALSGIDDDKFGDESVGKAVINSFVKNESVTEAVLGAVFNTNPAKFVNGDNGSLTNAGVALMAALNEKINNAGDDKKAEIITSALNQIDATKFGDNSVGKAVVTSLMNNKEIKPEVFASVFNKVAEGRLVKNDKELTEAGKALLDKMIEKGLSLDDLNSVVDGKIKNYQNDDKGIKTTDDATTPKLQVNRAKYYFNYLKNRKSTRKTTEKIIDDTESLVLFSLLKNEKRTEYFEKNALKLDKLDSYVEGDFKTGDVEYKDYSTIHKIEVAKNVILSGDASFIEKLPGYLGDANLIKDLLAVKDLKDKFLANDEKTLTETGKMFILAYANNLKNPGKYNGITYSTPWFHKDKAEEICIGGVSFRCYKGSANKIMIFN